MLDSDTRIKKLQEVLNIKIEPVESLTGAFFKGLKQTFDNYLWMIHYKSSTYETTTNILCDNQLVFSHSIQTTNYRNQLLSFVENFILKEKLDILFKEIKNE